jgi:tetratricopeptide (TPR) repeat protein
LNDLNTQNLAGQDAGQHIAAIKATLGDGDTARAADLAAAAYAAGLRHPFVLHVLARREEHAGSYAQALILLERATELDPSDAELRIDTGHCLFQLGRLREALAVFDAVLAFRPDHLAALCNKAAVLAARGDRAAAMGLYERAAVIGSGDPRPLAALAELAIRAGDSGRARAAATQSLAADPHQPRCRLVLAEADVVDGRFEAAQSALTGLLGDPQFPDELRSRAKTFLGDALDGLDRPSEAFAAYLAVGDAGSRSGRTLGAGQPDTPAQLAARLTRYFTRADADAWKTAPGPDRIGGGLVRQHVFLVGFPRSGTTLLEQALASHPGVVSLEETAALAQPSLQWLARNELVDRLSRLGAEDADRSRELYWRAVGELEDLGGRRPVLVDKAPLHTVRLPLIAKLFPDAKILLARRDPRDVVFSCFRRRLAMNSPSNEFSTPERAADYYDRVMALTNIYRAMLPLDIHVVRHEDMVAGFEAEVTAALRFIGLDWDPAIHLYADRARDRSKTPSAAQVARGVNAEGLGQWRRYEAELAPALERLTPWVEQFGYGESAAARAPPRPAPAATAAPATPSTAQRAPITADTAAAEAQRAIARGDWAGAFRIAELSPPGEQPLLFKLRAIRNEQQGRLEAATADFERALALGPNDFGVLNALGLCLARLGRTGAALERLDAALALAPTYAPIHYNRGWTLESTGDLVGARTAYERAVELDPAHVQALANLAALAVRTSDWDRARGLALRALKLDPTHPTASIALAQLDLAEDGLAAAEARLATLLADRTRPTLYDRSLALTALGDVRDRQARFDEAFGAYSQANAGLKAIHAGRFAAPGVESGLARVLRLTEEFGQATVGASSSPAGEPGWPSGHVFVLGFPRSGTTLMGQVLESHAGVDTLDEQETLIDAAEAFLVPGGLARLRDAGDAELAPYRDAYWRRVASAGVDPRGRVFVDKLPMNTLGLPLIARLFPTAKIIFVRRDPRDVVLSAFRRQFGINSATWELLSLEGAARFYDAVMRWAEACLAQLLLDVRVQSYEALTLDFEAERRGMAAFLGLDPRAFGDDLGAASRAGRIATPSAAQISRGLYTEGSGQWRSYAGALSPVLPILLPWVERFGYPAE